MIAFPRWDLFAQVSIGSDIHDGVQRGNASLLIKGGAGSNTRVVLLLLRHRDDETLMLGPCHERALLFLLRPPRLPHPQSSGHWAVEDDIVWEEPNAEKLDPFDEEGEDAAPDDGLRNAEGTSPLAMGGYSRHKNQQRHRRVSSRIHRNEERLRSRTYVSCSTGG